jgi:hypothetical protein
MKRAAIILAALATTLTGCGTASSVSTGIPVADHTDFQFYDERPYEERSSRHYKAEAKRVTVYVYGDETLKPPAPDTFKSYLAKDLNSVLSGKTVKLTKFTATVYLPDPSINTDSNHPADFPALLGSIVAVPLILGIDSATDKKLVTVDIRSVVDDREYMSSCSNYFLGSVSEENIRSVILTCLKRIHGDIETAYTQ